LLFEDERPVFTGRFSFYLTRSSSLFAPFDFLATVPKDPLKK
jgi:hypothetical protein